MARLTERAAFSYRTDAAVPEFDDTGPVVFVDGTCAFCSRSVRLIARLDKAEEFRICAMQSPLGRAVVGHYGLDPDDPDSWLYLVDGHARTSLDAVVAVARRLGGWARVLMAPLGWLPRMVRDWLYRRVARNRYRLMGRTDMCAIPDPAFRARLIGEAS